jgi:hypothetical protein
VFQRRSEAPAQAYAEQHQINPEVADGPATGQHKQDACSEGVFCSLIAADEEQSALPGRKQPVGNGLVTGFPRVSCENKKPNYMETVNVTPRHQNRCHTWPCIE